MFVEGLNEQMEEQARVQQGQVYVPPSVNYEADDDIRGYDIGFTYQYGGATEDGELA